MENSQELQLTSPRTSQYIRNKLRELFGEDSETETASCPPTPGKFLEAVATTEIPILPSDVVGEYLKRISPMPGITCKIPLDRLALDGLLSQSVGLGETQYIPVIVGSRKDDEAAPASTDRGRTGLANIIVKRAKANGNGVPFRRRGRARV